jgi:hypothetical protein
MKAIVIIITPEQAKRWLEKNNGGGKGNRKVSQRQLNFLTESILRGQWILNGETIKIGKDGSVIDGQHRLMAIVKSGMSVASLVVFDCEPESYNTIDKGRARTAGETFRNLDVKNWNNVAAGTCVLKMLLTDTRSVVALSSDERIAIYREHDTQFDFFAGNAKRLNAWGVNPSIELGVQVFLSHLGFSHNAINDWFVNFADDRHDDNQRLLTRALRVEKAKLRAKSFNSWWVAGMIIKAFAASQAGIAFKSLRFLFEETYGTPKKQ